MEHTYKVTEIVGSSPTKLLRNLSWFEVTNIRGAFDNGAVGWFQVTMKVGFRLDDD